MMDRPERFWTQKRIIIKRPDGGCSIVKPASGARLVKQLVKKPPEYDKDGKVIKSAQFAYEYAESEKKFIERIAEKNVALMQWRLSNDPNKPDEHAGYKDILTWLETANEPAIEYRIVDDESILPQDRTFRNAWTDDNPSETVDVNMDKARDIQMDRIRRKRDQKLKELDIETLKGNDVQAEKQKLRDIPQTFDLSPAMTADELKNLWPEELQ